MATLRKGSQGDEVKKLQNTLNQAGYKLDEDGIFGDRTAAAVRDYQSKNGLTVDGVVGNNTMKSLSNISASAQAQTQATPATSPAAQEPQTAPRLTGVSEYTHSKISGLENGYQPSERVQQAMAYLQEAQKNPVAEYQSPYDSQIQDAYQAIVGRQPFSYSLTGDMLYQQYKQQAIDNGRMAMRDTMGQAAALNGGYGSSYGQAVGQQQYNEALKGLNDIVPDLYNAAYQRWQGEGDELMNQYQMLRDQENQDYARWNDQYNRYQTELDRAQRNYESERDFDYQTQLTEREYWQGRAAQEQDDYWKTLAAQAQAAGSGRSGGGGGGGSSGGKKTGKQPTNALWDEARKITTEADMLAFYNKYKDQYDLDGSGIMDTIVDNAGINRGVTTREEAANGNYSAKVESEIKGLIAQKLEDPGSVSMSLDQLYAELDALKENRRYITMTGGQFKY